MKNAKQVQKAAQREPAEVTYRHELDKLMSTDPGPIPPGWKMSPRGVEKFLLGDEKLGIERKFVADRAMVVRIIISLCTSRGCLLVGEDRKSTRLNSSHVKISYAVFCLKKKKIRRRSIY